MSELVKARLVKLSNDKNDTELDSVLVQFNPASLRLTLSNNTEGGQSTGRTTRQFTGNAATELSFDLVFDTADESGADGGPRNVREKTARVEQFVLAQVNGKQRQAPPRVKFEWGGLEIRGVITQVSVEFDLFAGNGFPLRAKMGVSIKEQDAKYELQPQTGPGASREGGAPPPGGENAASPGSSGGGAGDPAANRTAAALAGESAADFAARMGLDPAAWRGLAAALENPLSLQAGLEIDFNASLSLGAGVGVTAGFRADVGLSLEASLGLETSAALSAGMSSGASASAGFALSAAGGVDAAVESAAIARAESAAQGTVRSFGATGVSVSAGLPTGSATAAASGAAAAYRGEAGGPAAAGGAASAVPRAYAPPRVDPRAVGYGLGVPLRPRTGPAAQARAGIVALHPYGRAAEIPSATDPTVPPWERLPAMPPPGGKAAPAPGSKATVRPSAAPGASPSRSPGPTPHAVQAVGTRGGCGCGGNGGAR